MNKSVFDKKILFLVIFKYTFVQKLRVESTILKLYKKNRTSCCESFIKHFYMEEVEERKKNIDIKFCNNETVKNIDTYK